MGTNGGPKRRATAASPPDHVINDPTGGETPTSERSARSSWERRRAGDDQLLGRRGALPDGGALPRLTCGGIRASDLPPVTPVGATRYPLYRGYRGRKCSRQYAKAETRLERSAPKVDTRRQRKRDGYRKWTASSGR